MWLAYLFHFGKQSVDMLHSMVDLDLVLVGRVQHAVQFGHGGLERLFETG